MAAKIQPEDAPLSDGRAPPPSNPLDRLNKPPPPSGGLFKEVNELRRVEPASGDENAKYADTAAGRLAGNKKFELLTFVFIGVNSLYIGVDADYSARTGKPDDLYDPDTPMWCIVMENVFCVYFTFEVLVRFVGYKRKRDCVTDGWFVFDSTLVTLMVLETWFFPIIGVGSALAQFSVLRLLRLLRISRMARLMKKVPELMIIIKGMVASFRSVGCTAILQVLILYVWSILFVSEYHEMHDEYHDDYGEGKDTDIDSFFGTMGKSMFSLFIYGTVLDDVTQCADEIRASENFTMLGLFIVFIVISSFTILNMLIGILCEVVSATADSEQTKAAENSVKDAITTLFTTLDTDGSGNITEEEFVRMKEDKDVQEALEEMDIGESHFTRYCEILFHQNKEEAEEAHPGGPKASPSIDFDTLITMILRLSPGNHINALDFSLLQASIDQTQETLRDRILGIHAVIMEQTAEPQNGQQNNAAAVETRVAALGDAPPPQPAAEPSVMSMQLPEAAAPVEYTMDMFERTSNQDIITEIERRLGVSAFGANKKLPKRHLSKAPPAQEAFPGLGVPERQKTE